MSDVAEIPKTHTKRRVNARINWLKSGMPEDVMLTTNQKRAVVALVSEGATLTEIAEHVGMPSVRAMYYAMKADPAFASELDQARVMSATTNIDEAHNELREALESNDGDRMTMASQYHRATMEYAAKIAPKEYGQLVKLAGADGGALTIQVIDYGTGGAITDQFPSRATEVQAEALPSPRESSEETS